MSRAAHLEGPVHLAQCPLGVVHVFSHTVADDHVERFIFKWRGFNVDAVVIGSCRVKVTTDVVGGDQRFDHAFQIGFR